MDDIITWVNYIFQHTTDILIAVAIGLIGLFISNRLRQKLINLLNRNANHQIVKYIIVNIIYTLLLITIAIIVLAKLGIPTASLLTILGASGFAIALALRDSLSNVAAGIILIFLQPFKLGDFVEVSHVSGTVRKINLFNTRITTPNNETVFIPNAKITNDNIINRTFAGTRRLEIPVPISYQSNIQLTKEIITSLINEDLQILKNPPPFIGVSELGNSAINLTIRCWVKSGDYLSVKFKLNEAIKTCLDTNNIKIPYNQLDVHIKNEP